VSSLKLFFLGSPRTERDGEPLEIDTRKNVALMAYLAITGVRHTREALATLLWPESEPRRARAVLRRNLSTLRKALANGWLTVSRDTIGVDPDADYWLDVDQFRSLLGTWEAHGHSQDQVCPDCLADLSEAVDLYRGDFLEGFSLRDSANFDDWQFFETESLREELASALRRLVKGHMDCDQAEAAIPYARRLVALDPLHEPAHRSLMEAYAGAGQHAAALRQYQECVRVLERELTLPPGPELTALYRRIRDRLRRDTLTNGRILAGQFALVKTADNLIARGGMAQVYQGTDIRNGEPVAIKVLRPDLVAGQPELVARFAQESEALRQLDHPNIVKLLAATEEDGQHYLVMEYVSGSLRDLLGRQGALPVGRVLDIALDLADALTRAHRLGIVHRDLKPGNVLLAEDGTPRLTDFGLARLADARDLTQTGSLLGTTDYLSPEACRGQVADALSDVWALGVVLYEMLSGQRPFQRESQAATLNAILTELPPDLAGLCRDRGVVLPPALGDLVARMLEKDPAERIASMRLVGAELEAIQADRPLTPITTAAPSGPPPPCPYRGLSAFREEDAPFFFGRETFTGELVERVGERPLVAVVGPSGSGKSSVVHAGLLPLLREKGDWAITLLRPGTDPLRTLAHALLPLLEPDLSETERLVEARRLAEALDFGELPLSDIVARILEKHAGAGRLLLVVDQFEEVYTLCTGPEQREVFLDVLLQAVQWLEKQPVPACTFLLTMRADFMEQALAYRPLADALQDADLILGPMTHSELRRAVENPAAKQGVRFEVGLVERILDDVGEEPGHLPLLEFALTSVWDHEGAWMLSHEGYEATGRVTGAVTRHADEVYSRLDPEEQLAARRIFTQLVQPGKGTEDTRRLAHRVELGEGDWDLVQRLADARLVVTGRDATGQETVELAHEALIGGWERLQAWMDEDRTFRAWQERLRVALRGWQASDRDDGALLRGAPLAEAEGWLAERKGDLHLAERAFVEASTALRERRAAEREAQRQRELASERRSRRLWGALAGVLALATVVALVLTLFSVQQRRQAQEAYSLSLGANAREALNDLDNTTALALALAANRIEDPPQEARRLLLEAAYAPGARWHAEVETLFDGVAGPATALDISPDGGIALLGMADGSIVLWDLETKDELARLRGHTAQVNDVAFGPDGSTALSGGEDAQAILWDLVTGEEMRRFSGHSGTVRSVDISPDGRLAVSGGFSGTSFTIPGELILWDLETGAEIRWLEGQMFGVVAAEFSPDGETLLASSGDAALLSDRLPGGSQEPGAAQFDMNLWNVQSGEVIRTFEVVGDDAYDLAISPDGRQALTGSYYNNVSVLWDLETGGRIQTLEGQQEGVCAVAFGPDGRRALSGSYDDSLILWDVSTALAAGQESAQPVARLEAHGSDVLDLAISSDGRTALSSARDGGLILWDLVDAAEVQRLVGHGDTVWDVALTPDGKRALSSSGAAGLGAPIRDTSIRYWELETGEQLQRFDLPVDVIFQVAISPDGRTALVATNDEPSVRVWDLESWQEVGRLEGHAGIVTGIEFAPDGERALSVSVDGTLILWDVPTRRALYRFGRQGMGPLWSLSISPDGHMALSDSSDSSMVLWDLETGDEIRSFLRQDPPGEPGSTGQAFLPDGRTAISCDPDGYLIEWDLETGEEVRRLGQHSSLRTRIVIRPDGRLALTSGMDGSLMLWDLEEGALIRRTVGHGTIFDINLAPDGQTVFFGSSDTTITQWRFGYPSLETLKTWVAANRFLPELTCAEREMYQIEPLCDSTGAQQPTQP
jgi:WD40 repeat protein/DNA-binding SARP family transcriptional activator